MCVCSSKVCWIETSTSLQFVCMYSIFAHGYKTYMCFPILCFYLLQMDHAADLWLHLRQENLESRHRAFETGKENTRNCVWVSLACVAICFMCSAQSVTCAQWDAVLFFFSFFFFFPFSYSYPLFREWAHSSFSLLTIAPLFFFYSILLVSDRGCGSVHLPRSVRQDWSHYQHYRGSQQQLRPA